MRMTADERLQLLASRFGLTWVRHRAGEITLVAAEVRDVDRCVRELYPQCLVSHGDAPVWMISWPAAFALAEHVLMTAELAGQAVLELGCGTAVPGVAAALAGARVLGTDHDDYALAVARENARANGAHMALAHLDWFEPDLKERYQWILGSEITYHEIAFEPLMRLLEAALAPGGRVLLADIYRPQSGVFLGRCEASGWRVVEHRAVVHLAVQSTAVRIAELRKD